MGKNLRAARAGGGPRHCRYAGDEPPGTAVLYGATDGYRDRAWIRGGKFQTTGRRYGDYQLGIERASEYGDPRGHGSGSRCGLYAIAAGRAELHFHSRHLAKPQYDL